MDRNEEYQRMRQAIYASASTRTSSRASHFATQRAFPAAPAQSLAEEFNEFFAEIGRIVYAIFFYAILLAVAVYTTLKLIHHFEAFIQDLLGHYGWHFNFYRMPEATFAAWQEIALGWALTVLQTVFGFMGTALDYIWGKLVALYNQIRDFVYGGGFAIYYPVVAIREWWTNFINSQRANEVKEQYRNFRAALWYHGLKIAAVIAILAWAFYYFRSPEPDDLTIPRFYMPDYMIQALNRPRDGSSHRNAWEHRAWGVETENLPKSAGLKDRSTDENVVVEVPIAIDTDPIDSETFVETLPSKEGDDPESENVIMQSVESYTPDPVTAESNESEVTEETADELAKSVTLEGVAAEPTKSHTTTVTVTKPTKSEIPEELSSRIEKSRTRILDMIVELGEGPPTPVAGEVTVTLTVSEVTQKTLWWQHLRAKATRAFEPTKTETPEERSSRIEKTGTRILDMITAGESKPMPTVNEVLQKTPWWEHLLAKADLALRKITIGPPLSWTTNLKTEDATTPPEATESVAGHKTAQSIDDETHLIEDSASPVVASEMPMLDNITAQSAEGQTAAAETTTIEITFPTSTSTFPAAKTPWWRSLLAPILPDLSPGDLAAQLTSGSKIPKQTQATMRFTVPAGDRQAESEEGAIDLAASLLGLTVIEPPAQMPGTSSPKFRKPTAIANLASDLWGLTDSFARRPDSFAAGSDKSTGDCTSSTLDAPAPDGTTSQILVESKTVPLPDADSTSNDGQDLTIENLTGKPLAENGETPLPETTQQQPVVSKLLSAPLEVAANLTERFLSPETLSQPTSAHPASKRAVETYSDASSPGSSTTKVKTKSKKAPTNQASPIRPAPPRQGQKKSIEPNKVPADLTGNRPPTFEPRNHGSHAEEHNAQEHANRASPIFQAPQRQPPRGQQQASRTQHTDPQTRRISSETQGLFSRPLAYLSKFWHTQSHRQSSSSTIVPVPQKPKQHSSSILTSETTSLFQEPNPETKTRVNYDPVAHPIIPRRRPSSSMLSSTSEQQQQQVSTARPPRSHPHARPSRSATIPAFISNGLTHLPEFWPTLSWRRSRSREAVSPPQEAPKGTSSTQSPHEPPQTQTPHRENDSHLWPRLLAYLPGFSPTLPDHQDSISSNLPPEPPKQHQPLGSSIGPFDHHPSAGEPRLDTKSPFFSNPLPSLWTRLTDVPGTWPTRPSSEPSTTALLSIPKEQQQQEHTSRILPSSTTTSKSRPVRTATKPQPQASKVFPSQKSPQTHKPRTETKHTLFPGPPNPFPEAWSSLSKGRLHSSQSTSTSSCATTAEEGHMPHHRHDQSNCTEGVEGVVFCRVCGQRHCCEVPYRWT